MQASSNPASSDVQIAHAALQLHQARALLARMSPSLHGQSSVRKCSACIASVFFWPHFHFCRCLSADHLPLLHACTASLCCSPDILSDMCVERQTTPPSSLNLPAAAPAAAAAPKDPVVYKAPGQGGGARTFTPFKRTRDVAQHSSHVCLVCVFLHVQKYCRWRHLCNERPIVSIHRR